MKRVVIVTNYISDYRTPVFTELIAARDFEVRILLTWPLEHSTARARDALPLRQSRSARIWLTLRHREVATTQRDALQIPIGLIKDVFAWRPDLIVSGNFGLHSALSLVLARALRIPLVVWSEETGYSVRGRTRLQRWVRRFLARHADAFLAWGLPAASYVRSLGVPTGRVHQCHQVVDNDWWMTRSRVLDRAHERAALGFTGRVFLLVGRLIALKGFDRFLDAWRRLPPEVSRLGRAVIVGGGEEEAALRAMIERHELTNVVLVGAKSSAELVRYYTAADVFVTPSLVDVWGMVVNEALCCGVPVLASRFAGAAMELVETAATGDTFDPTDTTAFAQLLERWMTAPPAIDAEHCRSAVVPFNAAASARVIATLVRSVSRRARAGGALPATESSGGAS